MLLGVRRFRALSFVVAGEQPVAVEAERMIMLTRIKPALVSLTRNRHRRAAVATAYKCNDFGPIRQFASGVLCGPVGPHKCPALDGDTLPHPVEGAVNPSPATVQHVRVDHRGLDGLCAPGAPLHCPDVVTVLQQMGCKRMAERVARHALGKASPTGRMMDRLLNGRFVQMVTMLNAALLVGILGLSALATHWYARAYITCRACGTLNARRRTHCRKCQAPLAVSRR